MTTRTGLLRPSEITLLTGASLVAALVLGVAWFVAPEDPEVEATSLTTTTSTTSTTTTTESPPVSSITEPEVDDVEPVDDEPEIEVVIDPESPDEELPGYLQTATTTSTTSTTTSTAPPAPTTTARAATTTTTGPTTTTTSSTTTTTTTTTEPPPVEQVPDLIGLTVDVATSRAVAIGLSVDATDLCGTAPIYSCVFTGCGIAGGSLSQIVREQSVAPGVDIVGFATIEIGHSDELTCN